MPWVPLIRSGYAVDVTMTEGVVLNGDVMEARQVHSPEFEMAATIPSEPLTNVTVRATVTNWTSRSTEDADTRVSQAFVVYFDGQTQGFGNESADGSEWDPVSASFDARIVDNVLEISYLPTEYLNGFPIESWDILIEIEMELDSGGDPPVLPDTVSYNCSCEGEGIETKTLSELRNDMLVELGFNQQLANPPVGTVLKFNRLLDRAQKFLFGEYAEARNTRWFTWNLEPGVRFYDLAENMDACTKVLNPDQIEWAGISVGGAWQRLEYGIPPEFYHDPATLGYPNRYEIRQCIEVFPAPSDEGQQLRIKGAFGLSRFTEDTDTTSIDADAVFYWAMGMALQKTDQQMSSNYSSLALQRIEQRTAAAHGTARYVPGSVIAEPWVRPRFLPLEE
jgi:hypothetical protein